MTFKHLLLGAALAATASLAAASASAAAYLPVGPQENVTIATVLNGGWSQCFDAAYGDNGPSVSSVLDGCSRGSKLMLAGKAAGSDTLLLLAQADTADVTFDTGQNSDQVHTANGTDWYFNPSYSWGFAPAGVGVLKSSCDASGVFDGNGAGASQRLCWHTRGGQMNGGWRVGENVWLNVSSDFEKVIFTYTGASSAPEPAEWALMLTGFLGAGATLRAKRRQRAFAAA